LPAPSRLGLRLIEQATSALLPLGQVVASRREVTADEVNEALRATAHGSLEHVPSYSEVPLVSADIVGTTASCIYTHCLIDLPQLLGGTARR
jgi:hypothetical protein